MDVDGVHPLDTPWPVRFGRHRARRKKQTTSQLRGPDKGGCGRPVGLGHLDAADGGEGTKRGLTDDACQPGYPHFGWWYQAVGCWESPASSPWVPGRASGKRQGGNCSTLGPPPRGPTCGCIGAYGARLAEFADWSIFNRLVDRLSLWGRDFETRRRGKIAACAVCSP